MKVETRERVKKESYEVFIANDGREFDSRAECYKYEKSARGVLNALAMGCLVKKAFERDIFGFGSEDCIIEVYKPTTDDDKKNLLQLYQVYNSHDDAPSQKFIDLVEQAVEDKDYLLVGRDYDGQSFFVYGTRKSMQSDLDAFCLLNDDEEDDI
ncbi:MAG: hypothetical protein K6D91_06115 [Prevotella sp.]|nr:hypothetical protein [Prevotella sp.]